MSKIAGEINQEMTRRDCEHGRLKRACEVCRLKEEIEELTRERDMWKETYIRDAKRVDELAEQLASVTKQRDELVAALEHLLEYWNGDNNETAMHDALTHFDDVVRDVLAKLGADKTGENNG